MARSIEQIQSAIVSDVAAQPDLVYTDPVDGQSKHITTNSSKRAIWRVWTFVVAAAILMLEQLMDIFTAETEAKIAAAIPNTAQWLIKKIYEFQYDATNPQVIQLIDLVPVYPVIDPSLRIVTRASVTTTLSNQVIIKVSKENPPVALTSLEVDALQSYIGIIGVAGINYVVVSRNSDKLYIAANVYYQGQYSAVIQANVIAAIEAYLASLPFDGKVKVSDLEAAIKNVQGVNDYETIDIIARIDADPISSGTYLVQNRALVGRLWPTVAGFIVSETTPGSTLADTLTFIPQ